MFKFDEKTTNDEYLSKVSSSSLPNYVTSKYLLGETHAARLDKDPSSGHWKFTLPKKNKESHPLKFVAVNDNDTICVVTIPPNHDEGLLILEDTGEFTILGGDVSLVFILLNPVEQFETSQVQPFLELPVTEDFNHYVLSEEQFQQAKKFTHYPKVRFCGFHSPYLCTK